MTHLAVVDTPEGTPSRAFVKHFPDQSHRGLFNEWFGHCMMAALGVPQPKAALIQAPVPGAATPTLRWAFVSYTPGPAYEGTPKEIYDLDAATDCKILIDRLLACHSFPGMVSADQLCMNADRNLGNLVFTGKKTFVVIDHGEILGGSNWHPDKLLTTTQWVRSIPIDVCEYYSPLPLSAKNAICASADLSAEAIWERFVELRDAMGAATNRDTAIALDAVWWRSLTISHWFRDKLQLML